MKTPQTNVLYVQQAGKEAVLSDLKGIPITINEGTRVAATLKGPRLYARITAAPYTARPFMLNAAISTPTNTTNATVDVPDADAAKFAVGDSCTYYDVSAAGLYTGAAKVISAIGAAGSGGGGAGYTLITFTGVWTTAPSATDRLCVADGSELSANALVVLEDIEFNGSASFLTTGYNEGQFLAGKVENMTYFDNTKAPNLQFVPLV